MALLNPNARPLTSLLALFTAWKSFLLTIALGGAALGPDYDTSTSLFFQHTYGDDAATHPSTLALRLTRWDALYYMSSSHRGGYVYEQEWAFGMGMPLVVRAASSVLGVPEPDIAIAFAHVSHLAAVFLLYWLTIVVCRDRKLAFLTSCVHTLSPGGVFLSSPNAESPFSALSFLANLLFALSLNAGSLSPRRNIALVTSGLVFGFSIPFRSNGIFGGILFAVEAIRCGVLFLQGPSLSRLLSMVAPVLGGIFVGAGLAVPQFIAWQRYCTSDLRRPWCDELLPSIYTFVQSEYWNVGFLRYWTPNQIPMFLLAAPMLAILLKSGIDVLREPSQGLRLMAPGTNGQSRLFVRTLAATQALLAVLAITNYHVQIISRISSAYPLWCWWVASCMMDKTRQRMGYGIVVFIAMYAGIQGGLFASFLPPA